MILHELLISFDLRSPRPQCRGVMCLRWCLPRRAQIGHSAALALFSKADITSARAFDHHGWKADIRSSRLHIASPPTSDIRNATSKVATEIILQMDKSWANFEILKGLIGDRRSVRRGHKQRSEEVPKATSTRPTSRDDALPVEQGNGLDSAVFRFTERLLHEALSRVPPFPRRCSLSNRAGCR